MAMRPTGRQAQGVTAAAAVAMTQAVEGLPSTPSLFTQTSSSNPRTLPPSLPARPHALAARHPRDDRYDKHHVKLWESASVQMMTTIYKVVRYMFAI